MHALVRPWDTLPVLLLSRLCMVLLDALRAGWLGSVDEDEEDFSYRRNAGNGPARWGLIRREWATCNVGLLQSPIGLSDTLAGLADRSGRLGRSYRPAAASLVNRGHSIMVQQQPRRRGDRRRGVPAPADALARAERARHQRAQVRPGAADGAPERHQQVRRGLAALQDLAAAS
uniref:Uncharacterized protein n=1 Tax=Zea mays TaxID=4577 RepID=A0A804R8A6_MAIZE